MRVLVTGGAGYVGSHMVRALARAKHDVLVVDDLSAGHADALPASGIAFLQASVSDAPRMLAAMRDHGTEAVLHFAARIQVGESVVDPRKYYVGNLAAAVALFESALDAGVKLAVLSSTAAVYGDPMRVPIDEEHPTAPINPYGETKLAIERMLASYGRAYGLRWAALRYFNAAGADVQARLDERHDPETHLVPIVLDAALGRRKHVTVFGDDYDTPDGTCIRDYVHVVDLAEAHLAALEHLQRGGESGAINLGTGAGHSVAEVIDVARRVTGRTIQVEKGPRRSGDPPRLVASVERAARVLGWRAQRATLEQIVRDAWTVRSA
ncbi:MAG TPA: UDP-glucose 4-epimerase GalE [Polyangiaceae bacterium]